MAFHPESKLTARSILILFLEGLLIGVGAMLPGISGGVLMVIFGFYQPMIQILANPKVGLPKYWKLFIPLVAGWLGGFFVVAKLLSVFLDTHGTIVTALFAGLILGTIPGMIKEGADMPHQKQGKLALVVSTLALSAFFFFLKGAVSGAAVTPNFFWFAFAGLLWGISMVAPGMTSSSILLLLGLLHPLSEGLAALDFAVILPFLLGIVAALLALSKLINYLIEHHYTPFYHCIIGFVIASTLPVIPTSFASAGEGILCWALLIGGLIASLLLDRFTGKAAEQKEQPAA